MLNKAQIQFLYQKIIFEKINQFGLKRKIEVKKRSIAEATKNQIAVIIFFINQQPEVHVNLYDTFTFFKLKNALDRKNLNFQSY